MQTDPGLHSTTGFLDLLGTLISSSGRRVRQVHFNTNLGPSFDTASKAQIAASVHAWLDGGSPLPKRSTAAVAHAVHNRHVAAKLPLQPNPASQLAQARAVARGLPLPLEYPRVQERAGASVPAAIRSYLIHAPDNTAYPIYTGVFAAGPIGQYYDVQGTSWTGAPQFASPDQTIRVGGRSYDLFYEGSNVKTVAWFEHGAVYWIHNSLNDAVPNGDMLAVAEQTMPVGATTGSLHLKGAGVPVQTAPAKKTSALETIGGIGGLLTLVAAPVLVFLAWRRRRQLTGVREVLETGLERGARLPVVPFEPGSAAARSAERARLAGRPGSAAGVPAEARRRETGRGSLGRRRALHLGVLVAVVCAAAVAFVIAERSGGSGTPNGAHRSVAAKPSTAVAPPTIPVSVLNAGAQQGAAGTLANQLRGEHVNVATVGNVTGGQPSGLEIMYAPGQNAQAQQLARLLTSQHPTVVPLDPATAAAAAAGSGAQLVVVIG